MLKNRNQEGFGHHFLLLALAILLIGFIGFKVVAANNAKKNDEAARGNAFVNKGVTDKLPACSGNAFFTSPVIPVADSVNIEPLGQLNPGAGQNIPNSHMSIQIKQPAAAPTAVTAVLSPGDVHYIGATETQYYQDGKYQHSDWLITYTPCQQFVASNDHVSTLAGGLQGAVNTGQKWCGAVDQAAGGQSQKNCTYHFDYLAKSGEQVGSIDSGLSGVDWSATDYRTARLKFINPSMGTDGLVADVYHTVCATDYYVPGPVNDFIQSQLPDRPAPRCGAAMQDLPGTVQGNWRLATSKADQPQSSEQMSIIHDDNDPSIGAIAIGGYAVASDSGFNFYPTQGGLINREPSQVGQDGNIYCYQGDAPSGYDNDSLAAKVLVRLTGPKKMEVESQPGACTGSESFSKPVSYIR